MKLDVPRDLTREQARLALTLLEHVIDGLIVFYHEMCRIYDIWSPEGQDSELPF